MGFHHSAGGHFDFPLHAHHICNVRASAVERKLLEVSVNQGRPAVEIYGRGEDRAVGEEKRKGGEKHAWLNLAVAALPFIWSLLLTAISDTALYLHV